MASWVAALRGVLPASQEEAPEPARAQDASLSFRDHPSGTFEDGSLAQSARATAPVVWLLGKVQSGKSSVIRAIAHSTEAEVGNGFRPCTRTARIYEFPSDAPVLRFLDTRGLGEVNYDPAEDLAINETAAHIILVTMRATDPDQTAIAAALHYVRTRHPNWPIVVAQTSLHDAYAPGEGHILPYPFDANAPVSAIDAIPVDLMRSLAYQRTLLDKLPGAGALVFVPVDLTKPSDTLFPADYGLDALTEALAGVAPAGMLAALTARASRGRRSAAWPTVSSPSFRRAMTK